MAEEHGIDIHTMFQGQLETFNYLISSSYKTATVLIVVAFVLTLIGGYWGLLLLLPAAWLVGIAEVNVSARRSA